MVETGFEPAPPKRSGPKPDALDRSATQPCTDTTHSDGKIKMSVFQPTLYASI